MHNFSSRLLLITATALGFTLSSIARGQPGAPAVPVVPENLRVPSGNIPWLKAFAAGTQNYVCLPGVDGPAWKFVGPQATLFVTYPWFQGEARQQIATHYLSVNPAEGDTARPTWQHSLDTSAVWAKPVANSTDPAFVAPGAIPWLLLEVVGTQRGPMGGAGLLPTTYIQRLKTSGGVAPAGGCDASTYGAFAMVPYTTDYLFYMADTRN
ncbi:MAG TPA: DUF3455 domain-containing protein [Bryobacteraceae bacterium]|nr:DUF3455 domain-containing protein [Bryobacteraceae bacterium]